MPKVIGATPPYLSRPSPGSQIFAASEPRSPASLSKRFSYSGSPDSPSTSAPYQGPQRLLASRGAEIFTVIDNKIRWADLGAVRDQWEECTQSGNSRSGLSRGNTTQGAGEIVYRVSPYQVYGDHC